MHDLIVSPFLGGYLCVRPGSQTGVRLPEDHYEEVLSLSGTDAPLPAWFNRSAADTFGLDLTGRPMQSTVLVRKRSDYGFGRASWEINLGCNFGCEMCYLRDRPFDGLVYEDKLRLLDIMRDAGVLMLQITGGEATIDPDFPGAYRYAHEQGMLITVSTNGSRVWKPELLTLFEECPPYRLVVSMYGASEEVFDGLTRARGAWKSFTRGVAAAREAGLPVRINIVVTSTNEHEVDAMMALAESWGLSHHVFPNLTPTIYGTGEPILVQSAKHLRDRAPFAGCNAGVTFFHADPHGRASICKVGRDDQIDVMREGIEGLRRLSSISDRLMLRTGGCEGCQLSGSCKVCRPLAKQYQESRTPLINYCQHGMTEGALT
ncbi:radical SAM protein [Streptomyces sp. NPDC007808]|uniref:radical SAM protein n=1 Tax=Streptomyces sp. NPDC007808 TaxID=3364779 RepID=UPI003680E399